MSVPTLLLIDVQRAFDEPGWGPRNNPYAERQIAALLMAWRSAGAPVIHVRHLSSSTNGVFKRGTQAFEFKPEALPAEGEALIEKSVNSAFIGTDLTDRLRELEAGPVVIAGLTTDHCCSTTARMAANLGFPTVLVADATATFDRPDPNGGVFPADLMHRTALASLSGEFAEIMVTSLAVELPLRAGTQ
jgi:nicotinamidase-related amidase